jgi:hypothetical protein
MSPISINNTIINKLLKPKYLSHSWFLGLTPYMHSICKLYQYYFPMYFKSDPLHYFHIITLSHFFF